MRIKHVEALQTHGFTLFQNYLIWLKMCVFVYYRLRVRWWSNIVNPLATNRIDGEKQANKLFPLPHNNMMMIKNDMHSQNNVCGGYSSNFILLISCFFLSLSLNASLCLLIHQNHQSLYAALLFEGR